MFENIRKELALFSEGHRKGSQSNNDLHKAMNAHITNLKLLGGPIEDIKNALPSKDKEKSDYIPSIIFFNNLFMLLEIEILSYKNKGFNN